MACYTVNLVSVEFHAKHKKILLKALDDLGWNYRECSDGILIPAIDALINLEKGKVQMPDYQHVRESINQLKVKYSETVIDLVAKKRRWVKKQIATGQYQLTKY
jgi:hypothetical protein